MKTLATPPATLSMDSSSSSPTNKSSPCCVVCSKDAVMECLLCARSGSTHQPPSFCSPACYKKHFAEHRSGARRLTKRRSFGNVTPCSETSDSPTRGTSYSFSGTTSAPLDWDFIDIGPEARGDMPWGRPPHPCEASLAALQGHVMKPTRKIISLAPVPCVEVHCVPASIYLVPMYY